jgi:hypothetical protein
MAGAAGMSTASMPDDRLDQALARILPVPTLPAGFRLRFSAALARSAEVDLATRRLMLERERREQLAGLQTDSVRLRWQTLAYLIGGAFAAGATVAIGVPWLREAFGADAIMAVPMIGAAAGLIIGAASYWRRFGAPRWLP